MSEQVSMVGRVARGVRSLTAGSSPMIEPDWYPGMQVVTPEAIQARTQGWQRKALHYAQVIPELAGAASLVRGSAARVKFVVEGGDESVRAVEQARLDALDVGRATRLMWLTGETWIAVPSTANAPYPLSVDEVNTSQSPRQVKGANGKMVDQLDPMFRIWIEHDTNRWHASSPVQSAMDILESMYYHQLADSQVAMSRLAGAGILIWPSKLKRMGLVDGKPQRGSQEELLKNFVDMAQRAISDRKSLDATIPFVVFADADNEHYKPELMRLDREDQADQYAKRFDTYMERLGVALDLPVESIKGTGDASRFTAWQVREDKVTVYLMPFLERIAAEYTRRHLKTVDPSLRIKIDASDLVKKPDATEVIMQMLALRVVTPESAIAALKSGDITQLVTQDPGPDEYTSNAVNIPPSDFTVNGERGGGMDRNRGLGSSRERR